MGQPVNVPLAAVVGAIWDLRDFAYDNAAAWKHVEAESVFQVMAEILDRAADEGQDVNWFEFPRLVQSAVLAEG